MGMNSHSALMLRWARLILLAGGLTAAYGQSAYPDQHFIIATGDSLFAQAESLNGVTLAEDGSSLRLAENATTGYLILKPQRAPYPFDEGLPSWNGTAPGGSGGFRVMIRFAYLAGWSPWLDAGFWKENLWAAAKKTTFAGGRIDIDTALLDYYATEWQFAVELKRNSTAVPSPTITLLSFFASDSRTTAALDYTKILPDKPEPILIETTFLAQYLIDNEIGGRICSPTTVAMILLSYGIAVDPLQFARDTLDPYYDIFGVWPRVVQNASEYGLEGMVTRYRNWSEARAVLASGGRIGMSIGEPLYSGHLVMLAGFTAAGDPIVHDPARTNTGYGHIFNKSDLSHSWFDKGGVAYTFFLRDSTGTAVDLLAEAPQRPATLSLAQNYPNPFNAGTTFQYVLSRGGFVEFYLCDVTGRRVVTLVEAIQPAGIHIFRWDGCDAAGAELASGAYFYLLRLDREEFKAGRLLILR
jgi:hypothetical protein